MVDSVHRAARQGGRSANEWVTLVLRAATDPDLAGDDSRRIQERLRAAGILDEPGRPATAEPDAAAVAAARQRAGRGRSLASFVSDGRDG